MKARREYGSGGQRKVWEEVGSEIWSGRWWSGVESREALIPMEEQERENG